MLVRSVSAWFALLLNRNIALKTLPCGDPGCPHRVPWRCRRSRFCGIYDAQFSIISWVLVKLGWIDRYYRLPRRVNARFSVIAANVWRGVPFVAITLFAGCRRSRLKITRLRRSTARRRGQFPYVTLPLLTPIIAVVMTFSVLFTFTDLQLIYVLTRGGPLNATHLMATLSFQRAISGGALGEGAAISIAMVPFLLAAIRSASSGCSGRVAAGRADK